MPETRHQSHDSFGARRELSLPDASTVTIFDPGALERAGIGRVGRLPFSIRILLENLLRHEDGGSVTADDIEALAMWEPEKEREIAFRPARVILQDFTGVPAVVDLAAMRDAMLDLGGDPSRINPLMPSELVIDHSVQVDSFGLLASLLINAEKEFERNRERYEFLRWGQEAFENFRVVPPSTGIVHQVNLEYLARVVFEGRDGDGRIAYPDTLVGTDSHTTMINGLGVLGWGVGGIEAEAAMLGQPISFLVPEVIGFRLEGRLPDGATATDLVLRVTEMLRQRGVVGRFVEFYGPGLPALSLADRATLGNMSPEFGSTCAIFPIDAETLAYLRFSGRSEDQVALVEAYARETGLFHEPGAPPADYTDALSLDLETVEPSIAGPKLPQQRIALANARRSFARWLSDLRSPAPAANGGAGARMSAEGGGANAADVPARVRSAHVSWQTLEGEPTEFEVSDGSVVIAAITSCTNTSNPSVMVGAGLVAKKAVELGLERKPWVKTSLAPGSKVVTEYLREADLLDDLEALGFAVVGYGCTTCIGNSGPLPVPISKAIREEDLAVCAVLSGNRNFEGRINPDTRANYLASPPLVVAYALAGTMDIDLATEPLGTSRDGQAVFLADIWPSQDEIRAAVRTSVRTEQFREQYADVFRGDEQWRSLPVPEGERYTWAEESTYVRRPPFFEGMSAEPTPPGDIRGARVLVSVGDSVTTDHISPAGAISRDSPAARYLEDHGVPPAEFNSYGSRRGNHEVMMRGTFANVRLRNRLVPGVEGGFTCHLPEGEELSIYDAAMRYADEGVPLIVLAGAEYGTGSSRDWAAKGPALLGIRAVIAVGYERIHRSNLIGMGILPLQFEAGASAESLGLDGTETYTIGGISDGLAAGGRVRVSALHENGTETEFEVDVRLDTEVELDYYRNGGILQTVLRQMLDD
ncbi:MAG: aconitate hydratase AcnA [marine benthic group bacterium]|nr:aconitate hydratase AcnA [Gemmatimonadota bacterium]